MYSWALPVAIGLVLCAVTVAQDATLRLKTTSPETRKGDVIYATKDEDVTIPCYVENLPSGSLVKFRRVYGIEVSQTEQISKNEDASDSTRYSIEKPTPSTWTLRVKHINPASAGIYTCYVTVNIDDEWEQSVKVLVFDPPVLNPALTSTDMTVRQGDNIELLCNASGLPQPTIVWTRQGNALLPIGQESFFGAKMEIQNIQSSHRGNYKCSAFNIMGTIQRNIEVKVLFKPIIKVIEENVRQAPGYLIELQCIIEGNPEPKDYQLSWYKAEVGISKDSGRYKLKLIRGAFQRLTYELLIEGVQDEDYGDYRCHAQNDLGNSFAQIRLIKSDVPYKSRKLGRVIEASAVHTSSSLFTVLLCLLLLCLNRVQFLCH